MSRTIRTSRQSGPARHRESEVRSGEAGGQAQSYNLRRPSADAGGASSQTGQAIFPMVLILTAVFGLLGVTFAGITYLQSLLSSQRAYAEIALQAAASGADDALLRVARNSAYTVVGATVDVDGVVATVDVTDSVAPGTDCGNPNLGCKIIDAEAEHRNVNRSLRVIVEVAPSGATRVLSRQESVN